MGTTKLPEFFQRLADHAPDGIVFADREGRIKFWNGAAEALFGYRASEAVGERLDLIIPEHLRRAHWEGFGRAIARGATEYERQVLTTRATPRSGAPLYVDLAFAIVKDAGGTVLGAVATARDVTRRYLTERNGRERRLRMAFLSLDREGRVTYLNPVAETLIPREAIGRILWEEVGELRGSLFEEECRRALDQGASAHFEGFSPPLGGWIEVHAYPSPAGLGILFHNVNESRKLEDELREREELLQLFVEEAEEYAIVLFDARGLIVSWNSGAERLYGYQASEALGRHFAVLFPEEDRIGDRPATILAAVVEKGKFEEAGWRIRKDGSRFWADVVITPARDSSGQIRGFGTLTRDMSERKRLAQERERLLDEAKRAVEARDEFLSIASHELRTPLTTLHLQIELLDRMARKRMEGAGDDVRPALEKQLAIIGSSERQSRRLAALLDELLDLTRIQLGRLTLDRKEVDLVPLIQGVVERFSLQAREAGSSIGLRLEAPTVNGRWDPTRIEQVVSNLVSNAIKYGQGTPIVVTLGADAERVRITVADGGMGIPMEMQSRIFDRFERGMAGASHITGLGLGLYIVKQLVEGHGGTVSAESRPGEGSRFTVVLPLGYDDHSG